MKTLLVGEMNSSGNPDPRLALYPLPAHRSGGRLASILGLTPRQYLRAFDRVNLCDGRWNAEAARARADQLWLDPDRHSFVLLGAKVSKAFGFDFEPFDEFRSDGLRFVMLPHPSGLCRVWNDPDAAGRARALVEAA